MISIRIKIRKVVIKDMNMYEKEQLIGQLKDKFNNGIKHEDKRNIVFDSKLDDSTGTLYCNMFGQQFTFQQVMKAYEKYMHLAEAEKDDDKKKLYKIAELAIRNVIEQRYET